MIAAHIRSVSISGERESGMFCSFIVVLCCKFLRKRGILADLSNSRSDFSMVHFWDGVDDKLPLFKKSCIFWIQ